MKRKEEGKKDIYKEGKKAIKERKNEELRMNEGKSETGRREGRRGREREDIT